MRKVFLLFTLFMSTLIVTSCSKDDGPKVELDPIIGTWGNFKQLKNGEEVPLGECDKKDVLAFSADGTLSTKLYVESAADGCSETIATGKWSNEGDSGYKFAVGTETQTHKITFDGDTFIFTQKKDDDTYKFVYKKK